MIVSTNQVADSLEKGTEHEDEYMISEKELLVNKFVLFLPPVYVFDTLTSYFDFKFFVNGLLRDGQAFISNLFKIDLRILWTLVVTIEAS